LTNEEAVLVDLYERSNPAVVNINTYSEQGRILMTAGQGSGFVYDTNGHIITNAHVVHAADQLEVIFWDGSIHRAEMIGEDLHSDLAVIKVEDLPSGVQPLILGNIDTIAVGQTVVAIGNPFGLGGTLTRGVISALGRTIPALTTFSIPQAIQTDAPINPGNSGGPLLNLSGEVIGVNAQIETDGGSRVNSGIGFAIPVSIVERVVPELIRSGVYKWSWLGIMGGSVIPSLVDAMDLPVEKGAYIADVVPGGGADEAGLKGATREINHNGRILAIGGDVIIAIDGYPVTTFEDVLIYITLFGSPGQDVLLTIMRDGKTRDVSVTLQERPNQADDIPLR
jgi:2-alkenal reductase